MGSYGEYGIARAEWDMTTRARIINQLIQSLEVPASGVAANEAPIDKASAGGGVGGVYLESYTRAAQS